MRVKICGITKPEQGKAIAKMGATALGFICVHSSPRYVTVDSIQTIKSQLPPFIDTIGVFANAEKTEITQLIKATGLSGVQLHGEETPEFCLELRQTLKNIEVIKALKIKNINSLDRVSYYYNSVDTLLLDAYHPQLLGGTGKVIPWQELTNFSPPIPWLLAGGLNPDNILEALKILQPSGIDLSSGVERSPGDKDLDKVADLFNNLRKNEQ
jgi:phosphoribosylanthranilate isomerase